MRRAPALGVDGEGVEGQAGHLLPEGEGGRVAGPERLQAAAGAPGPRPRDPTTVWREGLDRAREYFQGSEEEKSILTGLCKKGSLKGAKMEMGAHSGCALNSNSFQGFLFLTTCFRWYHPLRTLLCSRAAARTPSPYTLWQVSFGFTLNADTLGPNS